MQEPTHPPLAHSKELQVSPGRVQPYIFLLCTYNIPPVTSLITSQIDTKLQMTTGQVGDLLDKAAAVDPRM